MIDPSGQGCRESCLPSVETELIPQFTSSYPIALDQIGLGLPHYQRRSERVSKQSKKKKLASPTIILSSSRTSHSK